MENLADLLTDWKFATTIILGAFLYFTTGRDRRVKKFIDKIDGPLSLPIVGSGFWFIRPNTEIPDLLLGWQKKYGRVFRYWTGNQANVVLVGVDEMEKLLTSNVHVEKSTDYKWLHPWLGFGLLNASRDRWHPRRKLLTPAFHFKILEEFVPIFNEQGNIMIEILKKERLNKESFDVFPYITKCALDIICETAMGKQVNAQTANNSEMNYIDIIYGYSDIIMMRWFRPWLQVQWIWDALGYGGQEKKFLKSLHGFTESVITAKKKERKELKTNPNNTAISSEDSLHGKRRLAFLDLLLEAAETDSSLTDLQIREEVDTFMFEGHDTTAANMAWTIFMLSFYPEHQIKVQEELDYIFGDDRNRDITSADVSQMKYLECCVKETLRIYPSVAYFVRNLKSDLDIGKGIILPKDTNVLCGPLGVGRDPEVYPNPEVFDPTRFLPENSVGRSPFAFIPFSAGPRNCIGQKFALLEEKILLAKLLLNFNLRSTAKSRDEVKMVPDLILRPHGGIHIKITPRY